MFVTASRNRTLNISLLWSEGLTEKLTPINIPLLWSENHRPTYKEQSTKYKAQRSCL